VFPTLGSFCAAEFTATIRRWVILSSTIVGFADALAWPDADIAQLPC
jgi:hypothetical protein